LCQQRLGRFDDADRTFADVAREYPNTLPAQRAAEHRGARSFYVQLATYTSPAGADRAVAEARTLGVTAQRVADAKGRTVLRAGPFNSYAEAKSTKSRVASKYPDALILP
jgi:cell division septation protein DedD